MARRAVTDLESIREEAREAARLDTEAAVGALFTSIRRVGRATCSAGHERHTDMNLGFFGV